MSTARPSRSVGPLRTWAGSSPLRQLTAWLIRSAIVGAAVVVAYAVIANLLVPLMTNGIVSHMQNR